MQLLKQGEYSYKDSYLQGMSKQNITLHKFEQWSIFPPNIIFAATILIQQKIHYDNYVKRIILIYFYILH